jgi:hypothetical protein
VPGIADFTAREIRYAMRKAHCEIPLPLSIPSLFTVEDPSPFKRSPFFRALDEGTKVPVSVSSEFFDILHILQILLFF